MTGSTQAATIVILAALTLCPYRPAFTAQVRPISSGGWQVSELSAPSGAKIAKAVRTFSFPAQDTLLQVSLACLPMRQTTISIESYRAAKNNRGGHDSNPFVLKDIPNFDLSGTVKVPEGNIKLNGGLSVLYDFFDPDPNTVGRISMVLRDDDVRSDLKGFQLVGGGSVPLGALPLAEEFQSGNLLALYLPMDIEVQNAGGTEHVVIPKDNPAVQFVINKCSDANLNSRIRQIELNGTSRTDTASLRQDGQAVKAQVPPQLLSGLWQAIMKAYSAEYGDLSTTDLQRLGNNFDVPVPSKTVLLPERGDLVDSHQAQAYSILGTKYVLFTRTADIDLHYTTWQFEFDESGALLASYRSTNNGTFQRIPATSDVYGRALAERDFWLRWLADGAVTFRG